MVHSHGCRKNICRVADADLVVDGHVTILLIIDPPTHSVGGSD